MCPPGSREFRMRGGREEGRRREASRFGPRKEDGVFVGDAVYFLSI